MAQVMARDAADMWPEDPMLPFDWASPKPAASPFAPIEDVVAAFARGEIVVVVDDEDRENEGDLIMAAEHATTERIAFMVRHTSGVLCVPMTGERLDALELPLMVPASTDAMGTAYTITVDAAGRQHRDLGGGPGAHRPHAGRSVHRAGRSSSARPHLPAARPRGRRPEAGRAHRSRRRPGHAWPG